VQPLPIDPFIDDIRERVRAHRAAVVTAAPGAGKTTRVPPGLLDAGPVLLLQPRRVAARVIARRIALERRWTIGREVGWHVRFEQRASAETRLLVATEGILTARLQQDPLLSDFATVVIDEFHERSIHADLGLALVRQAWLARQDLRVVVMSATLDAGRVASFLGDCPVVDVPGRTHPIEIDYRPGADLTGTVVINAVHAEGAMLCFLPGAPEIRRAEQELASRLPPGFSVLPLHGSLDADEQDRAVMAWKAPRVILATNLAETTLTVPDVRLVVDTGLHKVARYDAARGVDSLELERITQDAADQRAGRAGRTGPGRAIRLWDSRDRLRPHREPEIARVDLASVVLDVLAWGGDPVGFQWFDPPPAAAVEHALALLRAIGAADRDNKLTALGRALHRFPLHPRLARLLEAAGGAEFAARAAAVLAERHYLPARGAATKCDLLATVDNADGLPPHVLAVARDVRRIARDALRSRPPEAIDEITFRRAVLTAWPDRVGRRRSPGSDRVLLASGAGARMGRESGVFDAEFIVALDVFQRGQPSPADPAEAVVRMATAIDRAWLEPDAEVLEHAFDPASGRVVATRVSRYGAIPLHQQSVDPDPEIARELLAAAYLERGLTPADHQLVQRLVCAGATLDVPTLVMTAAAGATSIGDIDLAAHLPYEWRGRLLRDAPETLVLPSGRPTPLDYRDDGRIMASVKLQELFGLGETPLIGPRRIPVTFELLAPNARPVQVTSDLRSFWTTTYPELRGALRARYPRHPWPEDPWTAMPTHRVKPRE
jgi:ATP-dependent helicase HrpB